MRCRLRPGISARANVLGTLLLKHSSAPQTAQDPTRHSRASLGPQRRPHNATHQTAPRPKRAAPHSTTRRARVSSISRYLQHRSAVAQRLQHRSISNAAVSPAPGISNIAVCLRSRYLGRRDISNIEVYPRFRIGIFANPARGGPGCSIVFWHGVLMEILRKLGPGRFRVAGGRFLLDFY